MRRAKKKFGPSLSIRKDDTTRKYFVYLYLRPAKEAKPIREAYLCGKKESIRERSEDSSVYLVHDVESV